MMTRTLTLRTSAMALIAAATLTPSIAAAQDAAAEQPPLVLPDPAVDAAPVAPIVLPEPTEATGTVTPIEPAAPAEATPVDATVAPFQTARPDSPRPAIAPRPAAASVTEGVQASAAATVAATAATPPRTAQMAPEAVAAAPVASVSDNNIGEIALAAGLGLFGLAAVGGIAFASSRRRRRHMAENAIADSDREIVAEPTYLAAPSPAPAVAAAIATQRQGPVYSAAGHGDPVALPAAMPDTVEERAALVDRLVAARPDKANPFVSRKARARRARVIVQSLNRSFANRKPRIDLSEYTNRWPTLRGWSPATA